MSASDRAIALILRAPNHFDMLKLPKPYPDLLEQPMWDCTDDKVNRAFRKLSLCCHPDKSTHPDAPRAFELLKKAKACLNNSLDRDDYCRDFVKELKVHWAGNWAQVRLLLSSIDSRLAALDPNVTTLIPSRLLMPMIICSHSFIRGLPSCVPSCARMHAGRFSV